MDGQQALDVDLVYNQGGVEIIKRFEFKPSDYQIGVRYIVRNLSSRTLVGNFLRAI